jgi:hypothetical protein
MSCDYCKKEQVIIEKETNNVGILYWVVGKELDKQSLDATEYTLAIFIDRGYLRLADKDDCNCLDHGEKVKLNYCPFCGEKINDPTTAVDATC